MEIIINIPEEIYQKIKEETPITCENGSSILVLYTFLNAIKNGTPLPKGHGELVDRDAINDRFYNIWKELESYSNKPHWKDLLDKWSMCMDTAPAIIKADGGGEE